MTESRRDRYIRLLKSKSDLDIIKITHDAVIELIEVLEEPERKWIPCSERLPEVNHFMYDVEPFSDDVLVAIKNEYGTDDTWIACLEQRHGWILNRNDGFRYRVIAWMPLPEPYTEDNT